MMSGCLKGNMYWQLFSLWAPWLMICFTSETVTGAENKPPFYIDNCRSESGKTLGSWVLVSRRSAKWPHSTFCKAISTRGSGDNGDYKLGAGMFIQKPLKPCRNCGTAGLMWNVQDSLNYDVIFFRTTGRYCYEYGYVENGEYTKTDQGECFDQPVYHRYFSLKITAKVPATSRVTIGDFNLPSIQTHFPTQRKGGVITRNGYRDRVNFHNFYYYTIPMEDPCNLGVCKNNATCRSYTRYDVKDSDLRRYNCRCLKGYIGKNCQHVDPCLSSPCLHGGTCSTWIYSPDFSCYCEGNKTGKRCQYDKCPLSLKDCLMKDKGYNSTMYRPFEWTAEEGENYTHCKAIHKEHQANKMQCSQETTEKMLKLRSCDCRASDAENIMLLDTITAEDAAIDICIIKYEHKPQEAANEASCSGRSAACGLVMNKMFRHHGIWDECAPSVQKARKEALQCISSIQRGDLDLSGCTFYADWFKRYWRILRLRLKTACQGCPVAELSGQCWKDTTYSRYEEYCNERSRRLMVCLIKKMESHAKCKAKPVEAVRADFNAPRPVQLQQKCKKFDEYKKMRLSWGCPAEEESSTSSEKRDVQTDMQNSVRRDLFSPFA